MGRELSAFVFQFSTPQQVEFIAAAAAAASENKWR
jgi:hypothetical protein